LSKLHLITPAGPYLAAHGAPQHLVAIFDALRFDKPSFDGLRALDVADWNILLPWCDRRQITLMLPWLCEDAVPPGVRAQIDGRRTRYAQRFSRLERELVDIVDALKMHRIECVVLKGFTHSPAFTPDPLFRTQGDVDLWIRGNDIWRAQQVLAGLGYVSFKKAKSRHLAPMLRPNGWKWRGDMFDPEMPVRVELHYELWSERSERIAAPGTEQFWERSIVRSFDGHALRSLCDEDLLGFAALHLLAHLLHGDLPLQRAWEIANFLHQHADDEAFWIGWQRIHPAELRNIELIVFQLVRAWFGCTLGQLIQNESETLPGSVQAWLHAFPFSPLIGRFQPNKDELWLHLALASPTSRARILFQRLLPLQIPTFTDQFGDRSRMSVVRRVFRQRNRIASRAVHHVRTLLPTVVQGIGWFARRSQAAVTRRPSPLRH
jgi:hypothetical protein